jgi:hypothetical protein
MIGAPNGAKAMRPTQGFAALAAAEVAAQNQKPGAELRPGSILQFRFPE